MGRHEERRPTLVVRLIRLLPERHHEVPVRATGASSPGSA